MAEQPSICRLPFTSACSIEPNNESCKPSSRQLRKVAADVLLPSQRSPATRSKSTARNAIAQAVAIGLLEKTERRSYCAASLPNILTYGEAVVPELPTTLIGSTPASFHETASLPTRCDDGCARAAPRTRRSPCDPKPAAAGGAG
jgi:hypothetical protein